jgi:hypothetical protein
LTSAYVTGSAAIPVTQDADRSALPVQDALNSRILQLLARRYDSAHLQELHDELYRLNIGCVSGMSASPEVIQIAAAQAPKVEKLSKERDQAIRCARRKDGLKTSLSLLAMITLAVSGYLLSRGGVIPPCPDSQLNAVNSSCVLANITNLVSMTVTPQVFSSPTLAITASLSTSGSQSAFQMASFTQSASQLSTQTQSASQTSSLSGTASMTASQTDTVSQSSSQSHTQTQSSSQQGSISKTSSSTSSQANTVSQSSSQWATPSESSTQTSSITQTASTTQAASQSITATQAASMTQTQSSSQGSSVSQTQSSSQSQGPSWTQSATQTQTGSQVSSQSASASQSQSMTQTVSSTPSASCSVVNLPPRSVLGSSFSIGLQPNSLSRELTVYGGPGISVGVQIAGVPQSSCLPVTLCTYFALGTQVLLVSGATGPGHGLNFTVIDLTPCPKVLRGTLFGGARRMYQAFDDGDAVPARAELFAPQTVMPFQNTAANVAQPSLVRRSLRGGR